jgi:putative thioredoxin
MSKISQSSIFETSLATFDRDVIDASQQRPILVDFWAEWCAPCLVIAPVLEKVCHDLQDRVGLAKLEVDQGENMKLAGHYRVRGFPTVMLVNHGEEVARFSGARSRTQIVEFLQTHLELPELGR